MKKLKTFLILFYLISLASIQGQEHSTLAVPDSYPHNANYSDAGVNLNGIAYGWSAVSEHIISVPIPEGQPITLVQPWSPEHFVSSMTSDGINYHIIDVDKNYWVYHSNSGNFYYQGQISGFGDEQPNGIAIDFNTYHTYFVTDENLYVLQSYSPFIVALIGSFEVSGSKMIDLAIDCCSNTYTYDIVTDQSYTIDLNTGEANLLGPIGFDANYGQGMSFDESSGQIFLSAFNDSTQTAQLRTLNTVTGETNLIVDWGFEQIAPFAIDSWCNYGNCRLWGGDRFEYDLCRWIITNDGGDCVWETQHMYSNAYELSQTSASGFLLAADSDQCGPGSSMFTTATMKTPLTAGQTCYYLSFDHDWRTMDSEDEAHVEVSTDGGATWVTITSWIGVSRRNASEYFDITNFVVGETFLIRFRVIQPGWDWWWVIDNFCIIDCVPVEFISFTATFNNAGIALNWSTATETNNRLFEIERRTEDEKFATIGCVEGHGTTTETQYYTFWDNNISSGNYNYRLKQIDYDGSFKYSEIIEVEVGIPTEFTLEQNYPNPFNPSTKINFQIPQLSFVTLKVYDVLGNKVATLINEEKPAGNYEVEFDGTGLPSGIYFYQLRSDSYVETKKMVLLK